ncbi:uncharacterized protein [Macrobrachium rosenbergii]|uniref:uncharacterized protein n=1 Tax=Macrobrachium rosenbergii TaxID=79674 RepID=UPI0034D77FDF
MEKDNFEVRANIKFLTKFDRKSSQVIDALQKVYGDAAPHKTTFCRWIKRFKEGRKDLKVLREDQFSQRADISLSLLSKFELAEEDFMEHIITGDETWIYQCEPESKVQSKVWLPRGSAGPIKFKAERSAQKMMATIFGDCEGQPIINKESQHRIAETHLSPSSTTHKSPRVQLQQTSLTSQQTSPVIIPVNHSETNSSDMEKSTEVNNPDLDTHNALTSSTESLIDKNNHNKKRKVIDRTSAKGKKPNIPFTDRSNKTPVWPTINLKQITLTASQMEIHSVPPSKTNINNDSPNMDKTSNSSVLSSPKSTKKSSIKHPTEKSEAPKIHQITTISSQPSTRPKNYNNNKPKNSNQNFIPAHRRSNIPIPEIPNKNISTSNNGNITGTQRSEPFLQHSEHDISCGCQECYIITYNRLPNRNESHIGTTPKNFRNYKLACHSPMWMAS